MGWNSPAYLEDRHGSFVTYVVTCQSEGEIISANGYRFGNVTQVIIDELLPFQTYNCCVLLQTTMANSTEACQEQETPEGGKYEV